MTRTFPEVGRRLRFPHQTTESILSLSGCCSAEDFTSLCPVLPIVADVVIFLTPLAIIVQRAGKLGCWEDEDFQWRKPQLGRPISWSWRFKAVGNCYGLSLFNGSQLAVDTTLVSPLRRDGSARPRAAIRNGVALRFARKDKERTNPELTGQYGRCRLVILAGEIGGRWSADRTILGGIGRARAQSAPRFFRAKAARTWMMRWKAPRQGLLPSPFWRSARSRE